MRRSASSETALLIIDMMNLFDFEGGPALAKSAHPCSRVIRRLRDRFDEAEAPVIYVNDNFSHWQGDFRELVAACQTAEGFSSRITPVDWLHAPVTITSSNRSTLASWERH